MNDIQELKSRLDIVEVVSSYVPSLKRAGHSYKGLCPFHGEKTPSFIVTPEMQIYKCFGCGEGGDVLNFIQKMERVEFGEALKLAADRAGYQLTGSVHKKDEKLEAQKQRIYKANELACKFWNYILKTHKGGKAGRDYMQKRRIRPEEMEKFQLGYAPRGSSLTKYLLQKGFTKEEVINLGFGVERKGVLVDKFRDRFILPIYDMQGNPVGFSGRIVTPNEFAPKYLNSPETLVYRKSEILMGLYQAKEASRKHKFLILEEGNIDLLSSHKVGVENIVATGGTAITEQQCKLIKRYADSVYFAFDTDSAGTKALIRGLEIAERIGLAHKCIDIGDYQDPDELINQEPAKWQEVIEQAENTVTHLIKVLQTDLDLGSADGKSTMLARMLPVLRALQDEVQLQHFASEIGVMVGISKEAVLERLSGKVTETPEEREPLHSADEVKVGHPISYREIYLLALVIHLGKPSEVEISAEIFEDTFCKEVFIKLIKQTTQTLSVAKFAEELSDGSKEILQQALAVDLSDIDDLKSELDIVYRVLYSTYLRKQLLDLRQMLQHDPENKEALAKLQYFTQELRQLKY